MAQYEVYITHTHMPYSWGIELQPQAPSLTCQVSRKVLISTSLQSLALNCVSKCAPIHTFQHHNALWDTSKCIKVGRRRISTSLLSNHHEVAHMANILEGYNFPKVIHWRTSVLKTANSMHPSQFPTRPFTIIRFYKRTASSKITIS